jgi:hypothetical protein
VFSIRTSNVKEQRKILIWTFSPGLLLHKEASNAYNCEQSELATLHEKGPTLPRKVLVSSECLVGTAPSICRTEIVPKFFPETHVSDMKCAVHIPTNRRHWERRPCGVYTQGCFFVCCRDRLLSESCASCRSTLTLGPEWWTSCKRARSSTPSSSHSRYRAI